MDLRELKEILQILEQKEITEFELEEQGMKLRIRKAGASPNHSAGPAPPLSLVPTVIPSSLNVPGPVALAPAPAAEVPAAVPTAEAQGFVTVKSPIVGTFYRSPDPGSPPFVNVSDRVRVGQVGLGRVGAGLQLVDLGEQASEQAGRVGGVAIAGW